MAQSVELRAPTISLQLGSKPTLHGSGSTHTDDSKPNWLHPAPFTIAPNPAHSGRDFCLQRSFEHESDYCTKKGPV